MVFSFIIVNYNTAQLTSDCLQSIFKYCPNNNYEIIVVDNASQDNSPEILKNKFGNKIKIITNPDNRGFAQANNQGATVAQGEYLFFLNSDTLLTNNILPEIKKIFSNRQNIGILAPMLLTSDQKPQTGAHGNFPSLKQILSNKLLPFKKSNEKKEILPTDWVSGAALIIRKNLFDKINGWDEHFFMYFEDADLCWRVQKIGFSTAVVPTISLIHLGGQSLSKNQERRKLYYISQNYFFHKHYSSLTFWLMKIIRWPYKKLILIYENWR